MQIIVFARQIATAWTCINHSTIGLLSDTLRNTYLREMSCSEFISHHFLCTAFTSNSSDPCHKPNLNKMLPQIAQVKSITLEYKILFPIILEVKIKFFKVYLKIYITVSSRKQITVRLVLLAASSLK